MAELLTTIIAKIGASLIEALVLRLVQALFTAAFRPKAVAAV
jgi:hypothetical protein